MDSSIIKQPCVTCLYSHNGIYIYIYIVRRAFLFIGIGYIYVSTYIEYN